MPLIKPYRDVWPRIDTSAFIAENATLIGDVLVGPDVSVWYGVTIRGDVNNITIGARTNIQDGCLIHVSSYTQGTYVGEDVTVGHMALLHACTIGNRVLVGMQACVMDDVQIGDDVIIAAGALVTPGKIIPAGQLWAGRPARYVRDLTPDDIQMIKISAAKYVQLAQEYKDS
jgi:carbonic anhydrase/acetyltransferase-like protein (isoleucine patch superfamily)